MTQIEPSRYRARREQLWANLGGGVVVLPTAPEQTRNADSHYAYRFDSHFYYLTGFEEPEAILVMVSGSQGARHILFCREKHLEREIWDGFRYGPDKAKEVFGFDEAYAFESFTEKLPDLLKGHQQLVFPIGFDAAFDQQVLAIRSKLIPSVERTGEEVPHRIIDLLPEIAALRLLKDEAEVARLQRASDISASAHLRAMRFTRPGLFEYQVEAEILHEFVSNGARSPAYTSIVAGGANACVLHYITNQDVLKDGELLLIDAGCEYQGYAGDITRTFPVNGKFNPIQKDLYELVLASQYAALDKTKPGCGVRDGHFATLRVLSQGMLDLGLLKGTVDEVIEQETYKRFYMHGTGHWLGLDVHDCGRYKTGDQWTTLQPGMMVTVEPGIYIRPADDVPEAFWNIGIRIEDDVLITPEGHRILTHAAPKTVAEIESLMADR
ncbi:Xaa-Pro aminopeptidase [Leeia oryzae]|uniref:Xaa-Pro aminopeptidase n=1 Tax=Leeia oryzae TaxID=356662 RepID=UPI0003755989|nr:Xaa-Pro aminopeptidase [Leeia oryzae]